MPLTASSGRLTLALRLRFAGQDVQATLTGGDAHVGGTALAAPGVAAQSLSLPGHRDAELARQLAQGLADGLDCTACVTAGIHYAGMTHEEIEECRRLTDELLRAALTRLGKEQGRCHADPTRS